LLVVLLVFSLLVLSLAKAVPSWRTAIQRERENRMIDRAREYRTAIQRYFHKYGRYPPSLKVLAQKDGFGLRYLRQDWPDPLNRGDAGKWQVLHFGQAVTAEIVDQPPAAAQQTGLGGIAGPNLGASPGPGTTAGPASPGIALGGALGAAVGATMGATMGMPGGGMPGAPGAAPGLASGLGAGPTSGPGAGLGGGPVIGVASLSKQPAVHAFNGFDTPNKWQFVYNYALDPSLRAPGAPATGAGTIPGSPLVPGMGPTTPPPPPAGGRGGGGL